MLHHSMKQVPPKHKKEKNITFSAISLIKGGPIKRFSATELLRWEETEAFYFALFN